MKKYSSVNFVTKQPITNNLFVQHSTIKINWFLLEFSILTAIGKSNEKLVAPYKWEISTVSSPNSKKWEPKKTPLFSTTTRNWFPAWMSSKTGRVSKLRSLKRGLSISLKPRPEELPTRGPSTNDYIGDYQTSSHSFTPKQREEDLIKVSLNIIFNIYQSFYFQDALTSWSMASRSRSSSKSSFRWSRQLM